MADNVSILGDLADSYDALVSYDEAQLDQYVEHSGYSLRSMVLASTVKALMQFSQSMVDVGRVGNGVLIDRSWTGAGRDALRVLTIAGAAGAVVGRAGALLRVTQEAGQSTCALVAQTNAFRLSGQRYLMTLDKLADMAGIDLPKVIASGSGSSEYTQLVAALRQAGIPTRVLMQGGGTLEDMVAAIRANPGGVVTAGVRFVRDGETVAHRLWATWSRVSGLIIRDPHGQTYRSIADLIARFGPEASLNTTPMIFVENSVLVQGAAAADAAGGLAAMYSEIAFPVVPVVPVRAADAPTAAQVLTLREQAVGAIATAHPSHRHHHFHLVKPGDTLSMLALHYYHNGKKWPLIYEANRRTIGRNANLIYPGQQLVIPDPPHVHLH